MTKEYKPTNLRRQSSRKNHLVHFRAEEDMYGFLGEVAKEFNWDVSTACRRIIDWYMMSVLMGEFKMKGLEKRFEHWRREVTRPTAGKRRQEN